MNAALRKYAVAGLAVVTPLLVGGTAVAEVTTDPPPVHLGNPALWGPPLAALCADKDLAEAAGYNVIEGTNFGDELSGGPAADVLYGYGGNDELYGAFGDDVLCGGFGDDKLRGQGGNDAEFGEAHDDILRGDKGRDFLDGGSQNDDCDGGAGANAWANCTP